jgi:NAD+ kinase
LRSLGYEAVLADDDAHRCGVPLLGIVHAEIGAPELAIALGGDGTILKAVHLLGASDTPVLGINLGRLGFLSGAGGTMMLEAVDAALAGEARIECRQTLEASVSAGGRSAGSYRALNELFVGRSGLARGVELELAVNGEPLYRFICDGMIVATPTGSTAYALSAGGPIISPEVRGLVFVPVAAHALDARPVVFAPSDIVTISCPNPARADACVMADGDPVPCRTALDAVEVRVGDRDVRLMKLDGRDFYSTLASTFLGG